MPVLLLTDVQLKTMPPSATVRVENEPVGRTPVHLSWPAARGPVEVSIERDGYEPHELVVPSAASGEIMVVLRPVESRSQREAPGEGSASDQGQAPDRGQAPDQGKASESSLSSSKATEERRRRRRRRRSPKKPASQPSTQRPSIETPPIRPSKPDYRRIDDWQDY
ncbi:MAG: PEGA domain-containing protein [Myxococcota bacterium]